MKKLKTACLLFILMSVGHFSHAQTTDLPPEASQFDFWIGNWNMYVNDSLFGTNSVSKVLDGYAIEDDFIEFPPDPFHGKSLSSYNADTKKWEQTMVDNKGHHSLFIGEFKDGKMMLVYNYLNKKGEKRKQRTTFYNITSNSFDWLFETSFDEGKTWQELYKVHYKRK